MPQHIKPTPERYCPVCGTKMERKRYGGRGRLEDMTRFMSRKTCGPVCGSTKTEVTKSALHWRAKKHRKANCETCGTANDLHVHHIDRNPANNDPANLMTLCSSCHLKLHWREDRDKRMASRRRRPPQPCVMCGEMFHPRWAKKQTCSPECKAALLSLRTTQHFQEYGGPTRQRSSDGRWSSADPHRLRPNQAKTGAPD